MKKLLLLLMLLLALPSSAQTPDSSLPDLLSHRVVLMRDSTTGGLVPMLADDGDGQGPLTPGANLRGRTDSNGYLLVAGATYTASDGPLTPFANLRMRTDSNGYLLVAFGSTGSTIQLADGTEAAPGAPFANDPDTGIFRETTNIMGFAAGGAGRGGVDVNGFKLRSPGFISWSSVDSLSSAADLFIGRGGPNILDLRNGTNLQTIRAYDATGTGYTALSGTGLTTYRNVVTAGMGVPAIYGVGAPGSKVNTGTAAIATYANGAADGDFEVSATCLVTVATTHSFSLDVVYTDTSNVSRTMVLPVNALAGNFITSGLITNVTGAGNYESAVMHISVKASTAITIRTSAGGTFTTVTYFPRAVIKQTTP